MIFLIIIISLPSIDETCLRRHLSRSGAAAACGVVKKTPPDRLGPPHPLSSHSLIQIIFSRSLLTSAASLASSPLSSIYEYCSASSGSILWSFL